MQTARSFLALAALALASAFIAALVTVYVLDDDPEPVVENTNAVRCEEALDYRQTIIEAGPYYRPLLGEGATNPDGVRDYDERLEDAEKEIGRYC